jgi:hypothetical protein
LYWALSQLVFGSATAALPPSSELRLQHEKEYKVETSSHLNYHVLHFSIAALLTFII